MIDSMHSLAKFFLLACITLLCVFEFFEQVKTLLLS